MRYYIVSHMEYSFVKEVIILETVLAIGIMVLIVVLIFCLLNMARDKRYHDSYMKTLNMTLSERPDEYSYKIKYTNEFITHLDSVIASTCNIMFKEFYSQIKDNSKITRIKMQQLVENTCKKVLESLNSDNINRDILVISQDYWTWYIVHLVIVTLNDKFDKSLIEIMD